MNPVEEMSAFIELQAVGNLFRSLVKLACSSAPNPFPTFDFLAGQLINKVTFAGGGDMILSGSDSPAMPGQIALSFPVSIQSIDLDTYIQSPDSPGTTTDATYIVTVGVAGLSLVMAVVRVDVGANQHPLAAPVALVSQSIQQELGQIGGANLIKGGAVLYNPTDVVVTVRLATTDLSLALINTWPQVSRMFTPTFLGGAWAIFLAGGAIAGFTTAMLNSQLASSLPSNLKVSSPAQADWTTPDQTFGIEASVELDAIGACPTLLGNVDIHVTLRAWIPFTADLTNQQIDLRAHITHDTDQWDVFTCVIANIAAGLLGIGTTSAGAGAGAFFLGFGVAFGAATLLPGTIYGTVSEEIANQKISIFSKVNPPDAGDDATFTQQQGMPTLYPTPGVPPGESLDASVDQSGVAIRGTWRGFFPVPGTHAVQVSGDPIEASWESSFNCSSHALDIGPLDLSAITVKDVFTAPGIGSQLTPVRIFSVLAAGQGDWHPVFTPGTFAKAQQVGVSPTVDPATHAGLTGKLYIHSSAGLATASIAPLPAAPAQLTGTALILAITGCEQAAAPGPWAGGGLFNFHWLVDPAPWEAAAGVLHEWAISLGAFGSDTSAVIQHISRGVTTSHSFAGSNQPQMIRLVTPAADQLSLSVQGPGRISGSVGQRLLVVTNSFQLAEPIQALAPSSNGGFAVQTASQVLAMSAERGVIAAMDSPAGSALTSTAREPLLSGPSGAFRVTPIGLVPVYAATVQAVGAGPAPIAIQTDAARIASLGSVLISPTALRTAATAAPPLGLTFLRLNGRQVLVAEGSNLVVTQSSRFKIDASHR